MRLGVERTVSKAASPIPGGRATPMPTRPLPRREAGGALDVEKPVVARLAQDALDRAYLNEGVRSVPAACPGCGDDLRGRMLLVRDEEDGEVYDTLVEDEHGIGDGPTVLGSCWHCETELLPDTVILRDRQHQRARALRVVA